MRVAVTGAPGTGKTTATDLVSTDLEVVHLNDVVESEGFTAGVDEDRDSLVVDIDAVREWLAGRDDVLFESHLAHHFNADRTVVLRAHPEAILDRLAGRDDVPVAGETVAPADRSGAPTASARENAEAEALDLILVEAVDAHGIDAVYEIDTTDRSPESVAAAIEDVLAGERAPSAGTVSFLEWL